jgi:type I restriction-modification system DNA methylase subunit
MYNFFEKIGFTIGSVSSDIKPSNIIISENKSLTGKLKGKVFVFDSPLHTNSSFYVISILLTDQELFDVKRYIWNENKYDLYFATEKSNKDTITTLFYAKSNPRENNNKIASFRGDEKDTELIEKIGKWKFQSGAFWLSYSDFLSELKQKRTHVDKKLIEQLKNLKEKLKIEFENLKKELENSLKKETNEKIRVKLTENIKIVSSNSNEIIQALIDRTLFIKFLEDKHIINSFFYDFYFPNRFKNCLPEDLGYKALLNEHDKKNINNLFEKINDLFNAVLFKTPPIDDEFLSDNVLDLIYEAIRQKDWKTGQLSLFDFRFDVLPIEFISHIYEVFLEEQQADEGIFYTPDKLAHLIIDETIKNVGSVLDPSCGSGMFLILAFRKLLEFSPIKAKKVNEVIEYKSKLLKDYIYGIEKEKIAWRLSVFSLYLEVLKGINPEEIKIYIKEKLEINSEQPVFSYNFSENILCQNALETNETLKAHKNKTFDYIIGNPPFFKMKSTDVEINFKNNYRLYFDDSSKKFLSHCNFHNDNKIRKKIKCKSITKELKASKLIGDNQISQAFMLKLKDWAKTETRFGFVQNSSNFHNEKSDSFQNFFFKYYQVENFYELSRVKDILFRKAKESVVVTIFNNNPTNDNKINYYPVDLGLFSETFDLLIIQEDKKIEINQKDLLNKDKLRYYSEGNEFDLNFIIHLIGTNDKLNKYILDDNYYGFAVGMRITGKDVLCPKLNITEDYYNSLSRKNQLDLIKKYKAENTSKIQNDEFSIPYIEYNEIFPFEVIPKVYIRQNDIDEKKFRRNKDLAFFSGIKLLFRRMPITVDYKYYFANYTSNRIEAFSDSVFSIRLSNIDFHLVSAIINSDLINYLINIFFVKRSGSSHPKIDKSDIQNIPIPKHLDDDLVGEISELSKQLTEGKLKYEGQTKEQLNDLIFDLYDLNILEKDRIRIFFEAKRKVNDKDLEEYKLALKQSVELFFKYEPEIETYQGINLPFGMVITAIYLGKRDEKAIPESKKTLQYIINEILQENPEEKFIAMREKIYGENCIYIVKDNAYHSWSTIKAFEDGQEILNKIRR